MISTSLGLVSEADAKKVRSCSAAFVKVYSMPAIGRRNVNASARAGRRRINPMEETAECSDVIGTCRYGD